MSTFINDTDAVTRFTGVFSRGDLAADLGPSLSCIAAESLAGIFRALGEPAAADMWIDAYAEGDGEGDEHHQAFVSGYVVPLDPMDALDCDSCQ